MYVCMACNQRIIMFKKTKGAENEPRTPRFPFFYGFPSAPAFPMRTRCIMRLNKSGSSDIFFRMGLFSSFSFSEMPTRLRSTLAISSACFCSTSRYCKRFFLSSFLQYYKKTQAIVNTRILIGTRLYSTPVVDDGLLIGLHIVLELLAKLHVLLSLTLGDLLLLLQLPGVLHHGGPGATHPLVQLLLLTRSVQLFLSLLLP